MSRIRAHILLWLFICLAGTASGQNTFTGIFLSNNMEATFTINENDTLYIVGSLVNENPKETNIYNAGVIILTDSLVNRAGELFGKSTVSFEEGNTKPRGLVEMVGTGRQIIRGDSILFANLSIRDSVELRSNIHVLGTLKLNQWPEDSRLLLGEYTLKMYCTEAFDDLIGGIIEGEDETHYITSDSESGKIRMRKYHSTDEKLGIPAPATMGLGINLPNDNGRIIVERYHTPQTGAALGGIRKYYSIKNTGSGFSDLSIEYYGHDLLPEHNDQTSLRLFYSNDGTGSSYRLIESENRNSHVESTGTVEAGAAPFRYTVAATCNLPGLSLGADRELCLNSSVTVTPQWVSRPATGYHYIWNGDERTKEENTEAKPKTFTLTGDTVIWVKAVDTRGCSASDTIVIRALPLPVAKIAPIHVENTLRCISETWTFETTPENNRNYRWDFRDGTTAAGALVTKDYTAPGEYRVRLTVENEHLCTAADSVSIKAEGLPVPDFTTQVMAEKKIRLVDRSQFFSATKLYEWKVLDRTFTGAAAEVLFPDFGEYPVELTVKGDKCAATASRMISVTEKGSLGFRIDNAAFCQGAELQFTNESVCLWGSMTFEWDFGDGTRSTLANPVKTYRGDETAVYTVTLRAIDPETGWSSALTRDITVHRPPRINWGGAISTCDNRWLLQPEERGYTYLWSNGAASNAIDVTRSGRYSLRLTDVNGCRSIESADITLNAAVVPTISDTRSSCGSVTLDAGNPGSSYLWSTGATTRTLTVDRSGTYSVTVTQPNGCTGSKTVSVEIKQRPDVKINGPADLCEGSSATLYTAREANTVYRWNTGDTSPSIGITGEGRYRVTATNTDTGCSASDSLYVVGLVAPVIDLGRDRNVCLGQETILTMDDYHYATAVEWWKDGGPVSGGRSFAVSDTGTYNLRVTLTNGCSAADRIHFGGIAAVLNIDFLGASRAYVGDTLVFIDLSYPDPVAWNWEISSGYQTDRSAFRYAFWNEGVYSVKLSVDNGGCVLSKTKTVTVTGRLKSGGDTGEEQGGGEVPVDDTYPAPLYVEPAAIMEAVAIPNPSDGNFRVEAKLGSPSRIVARLFTPTGRAVASFIIPQQTEDVLYRCNFTGLPAGVYFLQLTSGNDIKTVKIVIGK